MWDANSFRLRHNHALNPGQAAHAAPIANAILRRGAPEGLAIATANARVAHRAGGGLIPHYDDGGMVPSLGAPAPDVGNANPLMQGSIQRLAALPPEKLQEAVMRMGNSPIGQLAARVLAQKRMLPNVGTPQPAQPAPQQPGQQPVAQAPTQAPMQTPGLGYRAGGTVPHLAMGGMSLSMESPWWARSEERASTEMPAGLLHSSIAGRTDHIPVSPAADSFVIPADVVSGLGEGNSLAGARALDLALNTGPGGTREPQMRGARSAYAHIPSAPRPFTGEAHGGTVKRVPIMAAGGEYIVKPKHVAWLGAGDVKRGHKVLAAFCKLVRARTVKTLNKLPGTV